MSRRKLELSYITNESDRKASYRNRKNGLFKKLQELTILCDVEACIILYGDLEKEAVLWPSAEGVQHTITRFKSLPAIEQTRRMIDQESFIHDRGEILRRRVLKLMRDNREKQMISLMYRIMNGEQLPLMSVCDLHDLGWVIEDHLLQINSRIEALEKNTSISTPPISLFQDHSPNITLCSSLNFGAHISNIPDHFFFEDITTNWQVPKIDEILQNYEDSVAYTQGQTSQIDGIGISTLPQMFDTQIYPTCNKYMSNPMVSMSNANPTIEWNENSFLYNINQVDPNLLVPRSSINPYHTTQDGPRR